MDEFRPLVEWWMTPKLGITQKNICLSSTSTTINILRREAENKPPYLYSKIMEPLSRLCDTARLNSIGKCSNVVRLLFNCRYHKNRTASSQPSTYRTECLREECLRKVMHGQMITLRMLFRGRTRWVSISQYCSEHFMEPEVSVPRSQRLSTCTYPEPDQSSPQHSILSLKGPS
jgi:hypothetical protein